MMKLNLFWWDHYTKMVSDCTSMYPKNPKRKCGFHSKERAVKKVDGEGGGGERLDMSWYSQPVYSEPGQIFKETKWRR